jgi:putative membrane protein
MTIPRTRSSPSDPQYEEENKTAGNSEGDSRIALAGERTNFARFRTSLALDRTTLAWIRTALTFATFGFGIVGFFRATAHATHSEQAMRLHQGAIRMGVALIIIGILATILAAFSHWKALRRLRRGEQLSIPQWPLSIAIAVLIVVLELYGLWSLFAP